MPEQEGLERQIVVRRQLHGATILTLHRTPPRPVMTSTQPFGSTLVEDLEAEGLLGHVLWSTDCSVDDVEQRAFRRLTDAGLFLVRLDLGTHGPVARSRQACSAVQVLRHLGVLVEYEFDICGTTTPRFDTLHANLAYLASIVCDGSTPLVFRWPVPDRSRCSPWLAAYRDRLAAVIGPWLDETGLSARLSEAWADVVVAERLLRGLSGVAAHRIALQRLTMRCNTELATLVARSADDFERYGDSALLETANIQARCSGLGRALDQLSIAFLNANADALIRSEVAAPAGYDPAREQPLDLVG
jgi:hypothetical protein